MKITHFVDSILRTIGRSLIGSNNEPKIKQKRDRHGNSYWHIHDLNTNKSYDFDSEQDVRAWIEQRYNRF